MQKKYWIALVLLSASYTLSGCGGLATNLPVMRFESPEVPGHLKPRFGVGGGTSQAVNVTNDASDRPIAFNPYITPSLEFPIAKASLGLGDKFEVGLRYGLPTIGMVKGKFQFVGDPAIKAKQGNFSMAVTGGLGDAYTGRYGDQEGTFGPGGYTWSAYISTIIYDFSVIAGYRIMDPLLIYISPYFADYSMYGSINQAASDNGTSPAAKYDLSGNGTSYGASLGVQYYLGQRQRFSILTEVTVQSLQWSGVGAQGTCAVGVMAEFKL